MTSAAREALARVAPMLAQHAAELALTETALLCGFAFHEDGAATELKVAEISSALETQTGVTWLHFSLANTRAAHFLATTDLVPQAFKALLAERDTRPMIDADEEGLLLTMSDLSLDGARDSSELTTLWAYASPHLVVSARSHPVKSADRLRARLREGLHARSGIELIAHVLDVRIATLREESDRLAEDVHDIEDQILGRRMSEQRERLGRVRHRCARIRRYFAHDRAALHKLVQRPPVWIAVAEVEQLKQAADDFAFVLDDFGHLYERAKLLQEELAAWLAEQIGRRLYVLSVLSAVLLPMTLISGIFGMNVAGLPGTAGAASFWWVMLLILAAGFVTVAVLRWRGLL